MNVVSQENEGYTAPSDEDTSPNSNSANALYVGCPCGLSRDELRHFHWIDADQKCMAKLSDGSACGHYYTEHYSLWGNCIVSSLYSTILTLHRVLICNMLQFLILLVQKRLKKVCQFY